MPNDHRFLSRRWLLAFLGIAALLFGLAMLHPYPRQSLFGPTIRGEPWCVWEEEVCWYATHQRERAKRSTIEKKLSPMLGKERGAWSDRYLFNHEEMLPLLLELAKNDDNDIRNVATWAILTSEALYQEPALPILRAHLQDPDPMSRVYSAKAIWHISKDKEMIPILVQVLNTPKAIRWAGPNAVKTYSRGMALSALSEIARELPELFPEIVVCADDDDELIRASVMFHMRDFGKQGIPTLLKGMDDPEDAVRVSAAKSLQTMRAEARVAVRGLERLLNDKEKSVREAAAEALEVIEPMRFGQLKGKEK